MGKYRNKLTLSVLAHLNNHAVNLVLREVSQETLILALTSTSEDVKEAVFANLPPQAVNMIRNELERMSSDVEAAKQDLIDAVIRLEEEGTIMTPSRGGVNYDRT